MWRFVLFITVAFGVISPAKALEITPGELYEIYATGPTDPFESVEVTLSAILTGSPLIVLPPDTITNAADQRGFTASVSLSPYGSVFLCGQTSPGPCGNVPSKTFFDTPANLPVFVTAHAGGETFYALASGGFYSAQIPASDFNIEVDVSPGFAISEVGMASAVPEPSTWAMMLIGFAGLGFAARHRCRNHGDKLNAAIPA